MAFAVSRGIKQLLLKGVARGVPFNISNSSTLHSEGEKGAAVRHLCLPELPLVATSGAEYQAG